MVKCVDLADKLADYVDGALVPHEAVLLETHLSTCSECAAEVADLRRVVQLVRDLEPVEVPASFRVALRQRLRALPPPRPAPLWRRLGVVGIGVPATIAAGLVGFAIFTLAAPAGIATPQAPPLLVASNPAPAPTAPPSQIDPGSAPPPAVGPANPGAGPAPAPGDNRGTGAVNPGSGATGGNPGTGGSVGTGGNTGTAGATGTGTNGTSGAGPTSTSPLPTPGSRYATAMGDVPTVTSEVPKPSTDKRYYIYNATVTVAVSDAVAARKGLEGFVQSAGGQVTDVNGQIKVTLPAPAGKWTSLIAYIRKLGTVQSITGDEPIDTTEDYNKDYADYMRQKSLAAQYAEQIKNTTDAGIRAQMESTLQPLQEYVAVLKNELLRLDAANSTGRVTLTLEAASASAATYTTAPVAHSG